MNEKEQIEGEKELGEDELEDEAAEGEEVILEEETPEDNSETLEQEIEEQTGEAKDFLTEDLGDLDDVEDNQDNAVTEAGQGDEESTDDKKEDNQEKSDNRLEKQKKTFFLVAGLAGVILLILGGWLGMRLFGQGNETGGAKQAILPPPPELEIKSVQRSLEPFFVPLSESKTRLMARIIIIINWDSISDKRFIEQKSKIRNEIFRFISHLAKAKGDIEQQKGILEEGVKSVIGNVMGISGGKVVIKEMEII